MVATVADASATPALPSEANSQQADRPGDAVPSLTATQRGSISTSTAASMSSVDSALDVHDCDDERKPTPSSSSSSSPPTAAAADTASACSTRTESPPDEAASSSSSSSSSKAKPNRDSRERKLPELSNPFRGIQQQIRKRRSRSAPPAIRQSVLLQEHFRVDRQKAIVLPGVPKHDDDFARDAHDFFNLVILVPIIALNIMNWNWDVIIDAVNKRNTSLTFDAAWTGIWFDHFVHLTCLYFLVDLVWILLIPRCVKSPSTIIQHHLVSLLYILIPYTVYELRFGLGVCMSVEINTWFLIARRVFNKQGFSPWVIDLSFVSFRVKLISICFYITWIAIRCIMYPVFMLYLLERWWKHSNDTGARINFELIAPVLHSTFCLLNLKWTYDLVMSKIRYWKRCKLDGVAYTPKMDKGL